MRSALLSLPLFALLGSCGGSPTPVDSRPIERRPYPISVDAGDVTLSAESVGGRDRGPLLVLINGGPGLTHEYINGLFYLATSELRVVAYDQRGNGRSTAPPSSAFAIVDYVRELDKIRQYFGVERIDLLGHSWGGLVAMAYVATHPSHVSSLILVDAQAPSDSEYEPCADRLNDSIRELRKRGTLAPAPPPEGTDGTSQLAAILPIYFATPSFPIPSEFAQTRSNVRVNQLTAQQFVGYDLRPSLARVDVPALVLDGDHDPFGPEMGNSVSRALPKARHVVIPGAGHVPWVDGRTAFDAAILPFLREHAGS